MINSFETEVRIDNDLTGVFTFNGTLQPGEEVILESDMPQLAAGYHTLFALIRNVNGTGTGLGDGGEILRRFIVSNKFIEIPFREDFEDYDPSLPDAWLPLNQPGTTGWELTSTGNGQSVILSNQNNNDPGDFDYLISPEFSLVGETEAFLTFEYAYKKYNNSFDTFSVLLSTDCGITYDEVLFSLTGSELGFNDFNGLEIPTTPADWNKVTLNLSAYAGSSDLKIAFLGINGNAGDLFLDNIEFFVNSPVVANNGTVFPNPTIDGIFKITFNRPERERVYLQLMDMTGRVVMERSFDEVLNQTYAFDLNHLKQGVYILQVKGETFSFAKRLINAIY